MKPRQIDHARFAAARRAKGLSQGDIARQIGVSQQAVDRLERGLIRNPGYIVELAAVLDVSAEWLRGMTDDPTPSATISREVLMQRLHDIPDDKLRDVWKYLERLRHS